MFDFLKKCMQVEEPIGVRDKALKIFSGIEGLDDIKREMHRFILVEARNIMSLGESFVDMDSARELSE